MEVRALSKTVRVSSKKASLVANLFRHQSTANAISILKNTNKKSAPIFLKILNSAISNAVNNHGLDASKLYVSNVMVNEGPTLKRFQPHSQGRATRILKRTSHLSVMVSER
ncbi:50S ribosomal protein L22 [Mycoplasmopsis pulmonis]|uniref:50S ribosomal protein L22 n=1 Tax=Mycoplasmopsis pulmonis TaxID=2107 RepID=UPI002ACEAE8F|nr:50S ribosomal protein L22 [Mycoplasmopsis pulmonis]MDZ7293614.1 50S ribosomal protein L22 [Mycoplasmopsis pulmonis]